MFKRSRLTLLTLVLAACGGMDSTGPLPTGTGASSRDVSPDAPTLAHGGGSPAGAVFTLSNSAGGNAVLAFARASNGSLTAAGSYPTGGKGTGAGTGSQGAVALSEDGHFLFAVNPASNSISSFSVDGTKLSLIGTVPSGGTTPISVTIHDQVLYVLNGGGSGNIVGFVMLRSGALRMLPASTRPLSGSNVGPAQVGFDPSGNWLVVTEKNTNRIDTYRVELGYAFGPVINKSEGETPFGFAFNKDGLLVVSEAFGGAVNASTASSYVIGFLGRLRTVSAAVPTKQTAACWVAVTDNGRFAYTSNTGSASVTGFEARLGKLLPLNADGRTGETGQTPIDVAMSRGSQFMYALAADGHDITVFNVNQGHGSLARVSAVGGLPVGTVGLAAR
jgi:6-phosphogluconolactonase